MNHNYPNLHALLTNDGEARAYFGGLPGYVQDHIAQRAHEVNSLDSLRSHADNATRGDG